jgi:geranylgeranyl diphosphate synthase type I
MCKLSCEAVGGDGGEALAVGSAIEMFHNFCVPGDTLVSTPSGPVPIGSLGFGDEVLSLDPKSGGMKRCRVMRLYDNGVRETFELETRNRRIIATQNHPFLAFSARHPEKFRLTDSGRSKVRRAAAGKGVSLNLLRKLLRLPPGSKNWWTSGKHLVSERQLARIGAFLEIPFSEGDFSRVVPRTLTEPAFEWKALKELKKGDLVAVSLSHGDEGKPVEIPAPAAPANGVTIPRRTDARLCQIAGLFLGDGCISRTGKGCTIVFSLPEGGADSAWRGNLRARYGELLFQAFGKRFHGTRDALYLGSNALSEAFAFLELDAKAADKTVPSWVFSLPREQKLAFLRGYLDSDGTVDKRGTTIFGSASHSLISRLKLLVDGLGFASGHVKKKTVKNNFQNAIKKESVIFELEVANPGRVLSEIGTEDERYAGRLEGARRSYAFRHARRTGSAPIRLDFEKFGLNPVRSVTPSGERRVYDILVEGAHNFVAEGVVAHNTLIHDDIMDDSEVRRGEPCAYKKYGVPLAINAGDGLFMMVWQAILESGLPPERIVGVEKVLTDAFTRVLEGQAIELNWYRLCRFDVSEAEYMGMVSGKTGALIAASCEAGALIGKAAPEQRKALAQFGMAIGLAFQIQDDVLNLIGSEEKYGKEIGGDISEGKRSLITIHALSNAAPAEKKELEGILASKTKEPEKIRRAIEICRKAGSIDYAARKAKTLVGEAKEGLMILPNNEASRRLLSLADFFIYREV